MPRNWGNHMPRKRVTMDAREIQQTLVDIGWPLTVDGEYGSMSRKAVSDFQNGYTFIELEVDGKAGKKTQAALKDCIENQHGKCGEFFTFREFASKGNNWIKVHPRLVNKLDAYRREYGPVKIVSGYRDPVHNREIGGAINSQHVTGTASDIDGRVGLDVMTDLGFSGIGIAPGGLVVHVDVRGEGPNNTTGANVGNPTIWYY